jgi:hypothetical protein
MQFVVRATKRDWIGATGWIGSVGRNGLRAVGTREQAQVFTSRDEAARAIDTLSPHFATSGVRFSIEPVEQALGLESRAGAVSREADRFAFLTDLCGSLGFVVQSRWEK